MKYVENDTVNVVALCASGQFFSSITGPLEILEIASNISGSAKLNISIVSPDNKTVEGVGGVRIEIINKWEDIFSTDVLLIGSIGDPNDGLGCISLDLISWIKRQSASGAIIISIDTGVFVLAKCGLLSNQDVIVHPYFSSLFKNMFTDVRVLDQKKIMITDKLYISVGVHTYKNLMMLFVEEFYGSQVKYTCHELISANKCDKESLRYSDILEYMQHKDIAIHDVQKWIITNGTKSITINRLAIKANLSERQFKRRFKEVTGVTPLKFIQFVRLSLAKSLLRTTNLTVESIGQKVGYEDVKFFRQIFKRENELSPLEYRKYRGNHSNNGMAMNEESVFFEG